MATHPFVTTIAAFMDDTTSAHSRYDALSPPVSLCFLSDPNNNINHFFLCLSSITSKSPCKFKATSWSPLFGQKAVSALKSDDPLTALTPHLLPERNKDGKNKGINSHMWEVWRFIFGVIRKYLKLLSSISSLSWLNFLIVLYHLCHHLSYQILQGGPRINIASLCLSTRGLSLADSQTNS